MKTVFRSSLDVFLRTLMVTALAFASYPLVAAAKDFAYPLQCIFTENETVCIDEIKGIYKSLDSLEEPVQVHRAQALCYGWIYMEAHDLERVCIFCGRFRSRRRCLHARRIASRLRHTFRNTHT